MKKKTQFFVRNGYSKKGHGHCFETVEDRYRFMEDHEDDFSIEAMSHILKVSRSGYYDWLVRPTSMRELADKNLSMEIEKIYYEVGRIHNELQDLGIWTS